MTASEWSKTYRQTRDAMRNAACDIAEAVAAGYTPTADLVAKFVAAKAAHDAITATKMEVA